MKDKWLKDIHDRMAGYETDEPDRLWESIQARMPQGASGAARRHAPLLRPWTKCAAAAAAVVLAFIGGISLYIRNDGGREPQRHAPALCLQAGTTGIAPRPLVPATPPAASPATPVRKNRALPKAQAEEGNGTGQRMEEKEAPRPERMPADGCATPPSRRKQPADKEKPQRTPPPAKRLVAQATPGKRKSGRVSLSAFTAEGLSASLHGKSMGTATLNATGPAHATWRDSPTLGILLFNQGEDTERHISHKLPVRTGISMAYRLNTRLEIGTGLTYTWLASDVKEGSQNHYFNGKQALHYVGIPLNLKCRAFSWKRLGLYASVGLLAEKCVAGKTEKEFVIDGQVQATETKSIGSKPFQLSANIGAGVQYDLASGIGLYAEPGISYYFDDGSDIETIYKEKPLNFNLNLGVRFTFGKDN